MNAWRGSHKRLFVATLVLSFICATLPLGDFVKAAPVTSLQLRLSTIKESTLADHTIEFITPTGVSAGQTITITYPTGFALGSFNVNNYDMAMSAAGSCSSFTDKTLAASPSGATWGVGTSGQVVTITSGTDTITAGRCVQIEIGSNATSGASGSTVVTNQTAAQNGSDAKILIGGTMSDSGTLAIEIVADNDVTVNATVDPSITCAFTGMTTTFSSLTTGAVSTSDTSTTITLSTNAGSGLNVTVYDAGNGTNPGLYKSTGTTYLIGSADSSYNNIVTLAAGSDGFGLTASASGGSGATLTVDGRFDASGGANEVGGLEVGAAAAVPIAAATGALASRVLTIVHKAAVSGLAPAGSYTDTLTYVCTGIF
jgi:hypothetical protein